MKIGCVYAKREKWPKWDWVAKALLQLGHGVVCVHEAAALMDADSQCDVLLFEHRDCGIGWRNVRDMAPKRTSLWVQWWWDLIAGMGGRPLDEQPMFKLHGDSMRLFDRVFVKERAMLDEYRLLGVKAEYMDQGCPSWWPETRHQGTPRWDVLVFGSADPSYQDRHRAVRQLVGDGFSVGWATDHGSVPKGCERLPWCHPLKLPALMGDARCVLCVDFRSDVEGYVSDRNWLVAGAGALPLLRRNDIRDSAEWICEMTVDRRRQVGSQLRERTIGRNTYEHRLASLLGRLSGVGGSADGEASLPNLQGVETGDGEVGNDDEACTLPCLSW